MWVLSEQYELAYGMKAKRTLNEKERKKPVEMKTALLKLTEIFFASFPSSNSLAFTVVWLQRLTRFLSSSPGQLRVKSRELNSNVDNMNAGF
jgi:hypothetical protein